jgi:hypothetical protein
MGVLFLTTNYYDKANIKKDILDLINGFKPYRNINEVNKFIDEKSINLKWLIGHFDYFCRKIEDRITDL